MKQEISKILSNALSSILSKHGVDTLPEIEIEIPREEAHGDYATPVAMRLARTLKKPPREIATAIIKEIENTGTDLFEKIEIAGPGFINFFLSVETLYKSLEDLLIHEDRLLRPNIGNGRKVQVEFVSANPTGPLHIGHGRGAAVGNAICNMLRAAGYEVEREFYINDAGVQVRLLGESIFARYQQLLGNDIPFPEDGYRGEYIESMARELIKRTGEKFKGKSFDECGEFITNYSYKTMLANIAKDLRDFGVTFERWQSEKELYEKGMVEEALNDLRSRGLLYEKDGAWWFSSSRFEDEKDRVVRKKDGEYTYFASDICYHREKIRRGFDLIIDIWGADHHGYVPRIRSALRAFDMPLERFKVILIQMVTLLRHGKPVQMSKRTGEFITLREVIDEVGPDIAKFIFLTRKADSHLDFDIEIAKEQSSENPVFYVQYAFARIASLFRQAVERRVMRSDDMDNAKIDLLKEKEEIALIKKLLQYPLVFEGAVHSLEPHKITYYLQELSGLFHPYYNKYRIISDDRDLTIARLCLCKGIQIVLKEGLGLLGVSAPERM